MEEEKYYIPDQEEFHIGFEYEYFRTYYNKWVPITITINSYDLISPDGGYGDDYPFDCKNGVRVKYLDKEDIESLGWKESHFSNNNHFYFDVVENEERKCTFQLYLSVDNMAVIDSYTKKGRQLPSFQGWIKNKSRLKLIMEMIGININHVA